MDYLYMVLFAAGVIICIYVLFKILIAPIKWIFKLLLNAALGYLMLILVNLVGGFFDFSVPINLVTCLVAGILGIPGVIFLVMATLFL